MLFIIIIIIITVDNVNVSKTMHLHLDECGKLDMAVNLIISDKISRNLRANKNNKALAISRAICQQFQGWQVTTYSVKSIYPMGGYIQLYALNSVY